MHGVYSAIIMLLTASTSSASRSSGLSTDGLRWLLFGVGVLAIVGVGWLLTRRK
jgi:hypothetical protein